ncbi:MAG: HEAT repeat domain-containing protein, partial [candidate division Zixibacteria bacterium]|nr:HEAT repeat domain-containing protein [candidate division Zixibacteria bacterium]
MALGKDDTQTRLIASGLNDRNNNVVSQTVASLGSIGSYRALNYIMGCYDNLEDEKIKTQILTIMGRLNNSSATDYALADIHDSANANIVGEAIVYLAKVGYHEIIPLLDSIAVTSDPRLNVKIAEALVEIGGEMVKPRLITLFSDSSAMVRAAAFDALTVFDTINIDYYIRKAFNDSDYVVCAKAVDKIGELKKIRMLPQLMTIIMMHDLAETDLKRSVVDAAGQFIPGPSDSLAEEILNQGLMDYDYLVSKDAAKIYKDKLGIDKDSYSSKPFTQIGERKIKSLIKQY